ncbi:MAG: hypothetical protein DRN66_02990, partial [Candidatus Nanohalarchaeota archaeon]
MMWIKSNHQSFETINMKTKTTIILIFLCILIIGLVFATPSLDYSAPTLSDNIYISTNWTEVNLTINEESLDTFIFNWNTTNYTFYDDSLVLAMNFNNNSAIGENSTHFVDISSSGNNGSCSGDSCPNWTSSGRFGGGLQFDGVDDYVDCGNDESLKSQNLTVEFWFKSNGWQDQYGSIISRGIGEGWSDSSNEAWNIFNHYTSGFIAFDIGNGTDYQDVEINPRPSENVWHHYVFTVDEDHLIVYLDGVQKDVDDRTLIINSADLSVNIMKGANGNNGSIDSVRIYNRALSATEARMHYQSEFSKYNSTQYRFYNNVTNLADGEYTYFDWANDTAGSSNQTETRIITIDTTPLTSNSPSENASFDQEIVPGDSLEYIFKELGEGGIRSTGNLKFISKVANEKVLIEKSKPEVKLEKWGNETFLKVSRPSVSYSPGSLVNDKIPPLVGKRLSDSKVKFINHKEEVHIYSLEEGMEYEVILKEKPNSNIIEMEIESQDLGFYYQPPLNQEKQEEGLTCNETDCWDENGTNMVHRPENVVGSYAVYHKNKKGDYSKMRGKNYMAGKAFHIYRPKIIDTNGNWIWGKLNVDEKEGILSITIPQEFLDNAVYPIKIDPTFGYDTVGGSHVTINGRISGTYFMGDAGTANSLTGYFQKYFSQKSKGAIYKQSDNTFVAETNEVTAANGCNWYEHTFSSPPTITAQNYYLVMWGATNNDILYYDTGGNGGYDVETYGTFPANWVPTSEDRKYSIYCTYTAGGGDTTPPTTNATAVKDDDTTYTFNTWTNSTYVNVTLSCDDGSGSGCNITQYCTDTTNTCTPNIAYSTPVQISTEGMSYIRFRSNDTAGNLETT